MSWEMPKSTMYRRGAPAEGGYRGRRKLANETSRWTKPARCRWRMFRSNSRPTAHVSIRVKRRRRKSRRLRHQSSDSPHSSLTMTLSAAASPANKHARSFGRPSHPPVVCSRCVQTTPSLYN
eukprot:scaffold27_cov125-Isochrysis_galbana.AAC.6